MRLKITAILASLTVFAFAINAQAKPKPPAAPAKPAAPAAPAAAKPAVAAPAAPAAKVDPKAAAKAEAEAKAKAEADAKIAAAAKAAEAAAELPATPTNFKIGGNIVQGYTFNPSHPRDGYNGTLTWTDRANEYQLNQAWMYVEVPTDTSKKDFDWGFRADTMFGSSYRWATSSGFEDKFKFNVGPGTPSPASPNSDGGLGSKQYGLAIPQLYLDAAYKSMKLRVGHIISPVGFFTVDTTQNVFNTIPYTYQYGEPFTHFGAFLYYDVIKDKFTVMGGVTKGGDNLDGAGLGSKGTPGGFLGTVTYVWDDKSQLDWVVHVSNEYNYKASSNSVDTSANNIGQGSYNPSTSLYSMRYFQTLVYKRNLTKDLQWVLQSDFGIQKVADVVLADNNSTTGTKDKSVNAMWFGANTYLIYQLVQQLQLAVNFEWFRDNNGVRVGSVLPTISSANASVVQGMALPRANYVGNFFQVTFGPKWTPAKNMFVRVNGRYDYFDGTSVNRTMGSTTTGGAALPFFDGDRRYQFVVGLDAALMF